MPSLAPNAHAFASANVSLLRLRLRTCSMARQKQPMINYTVAHSLHSFSPLLIVFSCANSSSGCFRISTLPDKLPPRGSHAWHWPLLRHQHTTQRNRAGRQDGATRVQSEKSGKSDGKSYKQYAPFPTLPLPTLGLREHFQLAI